MKRLTTTEAAKIVGVTPTTIREYVALGFISAITASSKRGPGKRFYFAPGEIEAFARGGQLAAADWRKENTKGRRGRTRKIAS